MSFTTAELKSKNPSHTDEPFALVESIYACPTVGMVELPRHIQRLSNSAKVLNFVLPLERIKSALLEYTQQLIAPRKIRLCLNHDGQFDIDCQTPKPLSNLSVVLSPKRIDQNNPLLQHKTTVHSVRGFYHKQALIYINEHCGEVIFSNQRDELTEGTRTNLWLKIDDCWCTPQATSGLLPGIARAGLLETLPQACERILYIQDLEHAQSIALCNSVIGFKEVVFNHR